MSVHWRLALRSSAWMLGLSVLVVSVVAYLYGGGYAGAAGYGVAVGLVSWISAALTVSLLTNGPGLWRMAGAASFFVRYIFVAVALGIPAYLGSWPALAMFGGFAGVYVAENTVLLPGMFKEISEKKMKPGA